MPTRLPPRPERRGITRNFMKDWFANFVNSKRNGLVELPKPNVEEVAYYLWIDGSDDALTNWLNAERIVFGETK